MSRQNLIRFSLLACLISMQANTVVAEELKATLRRPVALLAGRGDTLIVANQRSGSLSIVDLKTRRVVDEHFVAASIADAAALPVGTTVVVLDDQENSVKQVTLSPGRAQVTTLMKLKGQPTKLAVDIENRRLLFTQKWQHTVRALQFNRDWQQVLAVQDVELSFAPRDILLLPNLKQLVVAAAFGGRLGLLDAASLKIISQREIDGHNIRGLAVAPDGKRFHVTHQQFVPDTLADYEELHWGRMMSNAIQTFDIGDLTKPGSNLLTGFLDEYGGIGGAMADPSGVVTGPDRLSAVAFAGVGEVAVRQRGTDRRIRVQAGPDAMLAQGTSLYVANRFADSISEIDLSQGKVTNTISLGPTPAMNAVDRGEKLFFDARLSHDGWLSCHSCHTDGHSAGLLVDTLGDGDYGAPKRIPSLLGTRDTAPWGWTGKSTSLEQQIRKSVTTTMHGDPLSQQQVDDLVAYLKSLKSPPARNSASTSAKQGQQVFQRNRCSSCHSGKTFTSDGVYDVGLSDERDRRSFNPPSLLGVSHRPQLFHDARAKSLRAVINQFQHQLKRPLSEQDSKALLAYLKSL
ncbi:MAG: hypothetical protein CMJ78_22210 [Planctomycetaceae bacterium]|nr:hypothetical protein [Planctomycetaceae bacterium]